MNPLFTVSFFTISDSHRILRFLFWALMGLLLLLAPLKGFAIQQNMTPWDPSSVSNMGQRLQNLVYGSSSMNDVNLAMGGPPDEVVSNEQMFPIITNYLYYDENKSGAATVFVFENGFLVGMQYKAPDNQMVDLTYFLQSNGDRSLNYNLNEGYSGYYPYFPLYGRPGTSGVGL